MKGLTYLTKDYEDISSLKKDYYRMAKELHPDHGGCNEKMKTLNDEYESIVTAMPTKTTKDKGDGKVRYYSMDEDFIAMVNELLRIKKTLPEIDIEICGFFIYITKTKKENRNIFNKEGLGLLWNAPKEAWYYRPSWYKKSGGKAWDMEKIRATYGSHRPESSDVPAMAALG